MRARQIAGTTRFWPPKKVGSSGAIDPDDGLVPAPSVQEGHSVIASQAARLNQ